MMVHLPCCQTLYHGWTMVNLGWTRVWPPYKLWYHGWFCRATPVLVNLDKSLEVGEWLSKSGSRIFCLPTRPTVICCTGTHLANDHMEHLPEELCHLYHRACPSASQNDEIPHMWCRCPGKRQLGNGIPCFSDCTVQYVIDCSPSLHLETMNNVHAGGTSDMVSRSPPRKRPHLDLVHFFIVGLLNWCINKCITG